MKQGRRSRFGPVAYTVLALATAATLVGSGCGDNLGAFPSQIDFDWDSGERPAPGDNSGDRGNTGDETAFVFSAPSASENYVWIANETRGSVARIGIEGTSVRISTTRVGIRPTQIATTPFGDLAVVLNEGSSSLSVVRVDSSGVAELGQTMSALPGANRLALDPSSQWAATWFDVSTPPAAAARGPLAEVGLARIGAEPAQTFVLSVGTGIRDVRFNTDGGELLVMSDEGISRVVLDDVAGDAFFPPVRYASGDGVELGADRDFILLPSGRTVLVRDTRDTAIFAVDLVTQGVGVFEFDEPITDVDLIPGTAFVVVADGTERLRILDLDAFEASGSVETEDIEIEGFAVLHVSISPSGERLALSGGSGANWVVLADRDVNIREINVWKGVRGTAFTPDSRSLVVLHAKAPGAPVAGEPAEDLLAKSWAFSVIDVESGASKLVMTDAEPTQTVVDDASRSLFVLTVDASQGVRHLDWFNLDTFYDERITFNGVPDSIGLIPGVDTLYISQVHALGRIALLNVATGDVREVTGYELNSLIE